MNKKRKNSAVLQTALNLLYLHGFSVVESQLGPLSDLWEWDPREFGSTVYQQQLTR